MKLKNLNIRKAFFALGMSFVLTGCINETKEENNTQSILAIETSENSEINNYVSEENTITVDPIIDYKENAYTTSKLNLREGSNLESNVIIIIDKCQKISEIENLGEWSYIKYNDTFGYVYNKYIKQLPTDYIEVDISDQNIKYHMGENIILDSDVVTGKQDISDTRIGMFEIYSRETSRYLTGRDNKGNITYRSYVDYWMPFDGGIGLHDASWRDEFGGDIYINSGSHGCVNLPFDIAKTIYENSEVGTKVLVHK